MLWTAFWLMAALRVVAGLDCKSWADRRDRCECGHPDGSDPGLMEVKCPPIDGSLIQVSLDATRTRIGCGELTSVGNFSLFRGSFLENAPYVEISECPTPDQPIAQMLRLANASKVRELIYQSSRLSSLQSIFFEELVGLKKLHIKRASLTTLSFDFLLKIPELEILHIEYCDVGDVSSNNYLGTVGKNLVHLRMTKNRGLQNLPDRVFRNMTQLEILDLSYNEIKALHVTTFTDLINLKSLDLSGNSLQSLGTDIFKNLRSLENVYLKGNSFSSFPSDLFRQNSLLENVSIGYNKKALYLPKGFFANLRSLKYVNLDNSRLIEIPHDIFLHAINLTKVSLRKTDIEWLPDTLFSACPNLSILDISENKLANITLDAPHLKEIDIESNNLSFDECENFGESPLRRCQQLERINLHNNKIKFLCADWMRMPNLTIVNVVKNNITELKWTSPVRPGVQHRNQTIYVGNNPLTVIRKESINSLSSQRWVLRNNNFTCDCHNYDIVTSPNQTRRINESIIRVEFDVKGLTCAHPPALRGQRVSRVALSGLSCPEKCWPPCQCLFRASDRAVVVDCTGKNLTAAPSRLPERGDSIRTELLLANNYIVALPNFAWPGYAKVTVFNMSNNSLSRLDAVGGLPPHLTVIDVSFNNLSFADPSFAQSLLNLSYLQNVKLNDNPWVCDCRTESLISYVQEHSAKVSLLGRTVCADDRPMHEVHVLWCSSLHWILACIAGCFAGALLAVCARFRREIQAWVYVYTARFKNKNGRGEFSHDAFISYSHLDEDFVLTELTKLERGPHPLRLCLLTRDCLPGASRIHSIADAMEESRHTVVVLSPNFLQSEWKRHELRSAFCQVMNDGQSRFLIILYKDIGSIDKLDSELRTYLELNTYIDWRSPWFWSNLKYSLLRRQRKNIVPHRSDYETNV